MNYSLLTNQLCKKYLHLLFCGLSVHAWRQILLRKYLKPTLTNSLQEGREFFNTYHKFMKGVNITRYTSGDPEVVGALQKHGVGYKVSTIEEFTVTTLNRIKKYLEEIFHIQTVTRRLVEGIIEETGSGKYVGEGIDTNMNVCKMFIIHGKKFRNGVMQLLNNGSLRQSKNQNLQESTI